MKRYRQFFAMAVTAALVQACAVPEPVKSDGVGLERPQAHIPFANQRSSIHTFQADGREGLWVEDAHGKWYYGKFFSTCLGLDHAFSLGFDTGTSDRLDRYGAVVLPNERERCLFKSFTESDPPPDGNRRTLESAK